MWISAAINMTLSTGGFYGDHERTLLIGKARHGAQETRARDVATSKSPISTVHASR